MALSPWINSIKNRILDLLFPPYCVGCGNEGNLLCFPCRSSLATIPPSCFVCKKWVPETLRVNPGRTCKLCQSSTSIYAFFSPFAFDQKIVRELVHSLKYRRIRDIGTLLGELLAEYCRTFKIVFPENLVVVPLPLHKSRKRIRGFNQAELISAGFLSAINLPGFRLEPNLLIRAKNTKPQVELYAGERRQNMVGAFAVSDPNVVKNEIILLVDDVKTTGATLEEAARVLKEAGAKRVYVTTVAH